MSISTNTFAKLPVSARTHFSLHLYGAVLHLLEYLNRFGAERAQKWHAAFPFLRHYRQEIDRYLAPHAESTPLLREWHAAVLAWEKTFVGRLPLRSLQTIGGLSRGQVTGLLLAGLPEEDSRFGTVFACLQEPLPTRLPAIEFVAQIMGDSSAGGMQGGWAMFEGLVSAGLLRVPNPGAARSEWLLKAPPSIWRALRGESMRSSAGGGRARAPGDFPELNSLIVPANLRAHAEALLRLLLSGSVDRLVIRGMDGSGRLELLGAVARAMGQGVLVWECPAGELSPEMTGEVGPLSLLTDCLPVLRFDLSPGQTAELGLFQGLRGPLGIVLGREGGLEGAPEDRSITLALPPLRVNERREHWRLCLQKRGEKHVEEIAERFRLPGGHIRRVAAAAITQACLQGDEPVRVEHVRRACRELGRQRLDNLADQVDDTGRWNDLVVSPVTFRRLQELEQRCRHREALLDHLGEAFRSTNCGVRALFTGASGTGKTLAAKVLASVLEKDLYRVDLASVINKYIGETEKNLHRVLSRAEELDVILLIDEGDALLGNRTEVRSANDRYANLETNYLLQRLESYQGILLVTTNLGGQIDTAFKRRMDLVVEFVRPGPSERRRIFDLHLPSDCPLRSEFIDEVSHRCAFSGGQIRNVTAAALLALRESNRRISEWHLEEAIRVECRKAGMAVPRSAARSAVAVQGGMEGFLTPGARGDAG